MFISMKSDIVISMASLRLADLEWMQ